MNSLKRLRKEAQNLEGSRDEDIQLRSVDADLLKWTAVLRGPPETPYAGFLFVVTIDVPETYPLVPPVMKFATKIFHPNVYFETGEICMDILKKEWSPAWSLQSACIAIHAILSEPNPDSPLNCDAGNMLRAGDERAFFTCARMYAHEFAEKAISPPQLQPAAKP